VAFLLFLFLALGQVLVAGVGCVAAFAVTLRPRWRHAREAAMKCVAFGAVGGFVGVSAGYIAVVAGGFASQLLGARAVNDLVGNAAPFLLAGGYILGTVVGARGGWRAGAVGIVRPMAIVQ
jgi:hypothetical protein